jgi:hypothetical protein
LWTNVGGSLAMIAREGSEFLGPCVGAGVTFTEFSGGSGSVGKQPVLNDSGDIAFRAHLAGSGINLDNNAGIWTTVGDSLTLVARTGIVGSVGPNLGAGIAFGGISTFSHPSLNNAGEIVFVAQLEGDGISLANDFGIWAWKHGQLTMIVREGDQFDVDPDPNNQLLRTVRSVGYNPFYFQLAESGYQRLLNDSGLLIFSLVFTDGTSGVFTAQLPRQPGDFDNDSDVDGSDFVAWQTNFPLASGATFAMGDADGDGDVDGADFVVWQTNFPTSPGGAASPVPEPAGVLLALAAGVALVWVRYW